MKTTQMRHFERSKLHYTQYFNEHLSGLKNAAKDLRPIESKDKDRTTELAMNRSDDFDFQRHTVLLVDDDPIVLHVLEDWLSDSYHIETAENGQEAFELAQSLSPSLILSDIHMPLMTGYEMLKALRSLHRTKNIPVIFLTGSSGASAELEALQLGAADFIEKPIVPEVMMLRVRNHLDLVNAHALRQSHTDSVRMLGRAGEFNDTDTGQHIWRMAAYARRLAERIGLSDHQCSMLELAAPMHDIGKVGIPDQILKKPAKLDEEEWVVMKCHSDLGHGILSASEAPIFRLAADIARYHHEKWDGTGYPAGLAGEDIPLVARIVALADVFDALTMERPYKSAWSIDEALSYISEQAGSHFDPYLAKCFVELQPMLELVKRHYEELEQSNTGTEIVNTILADSG